MESKNKGVLTIIFHDEDLEKFINWKKLILGSNGYGGLKKRVIDMINSDLKKAENKN